VIPTYNEADNVTAVVRELSAVLGEDFHILFVDDQSPDGTAQVVRQLANEYPVSVYERLVRDGVGRAIKQGLREALRRFPEATAFVTMDADLSHRPIDLPLMLDRLRSADLVVGSRYVPGGGTKDWPTTRRLMSRCANALVRWLFGTCIADHTGFFRVRSRRCAELVAASLESPGFEWAIEEILLASRGGLAVDEVPIVFVGRARGFSKLTPRQVAKWLGRVIVRLGLRYKAQLWEFAAFCCVGATGLVVNLLLFWFLTWALRVWYLAAGVVAAIAGTLWNFALNDRFTFAHRSSPRSLLKRLVRFSVVYAGGVGLAVVMLAALVEVAGLTGITGQGLATVGASVWNYVGSKRLVWKAEGEPERTFTGSLGS
jgi:dolichol-phosphate mannosyltransferase